MLLWGQGEGPKIWSSRGGNGRDNLCHSHGDEHREGADNDPPNTHDRWPTRIQTVSEEGRYAGDDALEPVSIVAEESRYNIPTMIENDMPKLCIRDQSLRSSCL